MVTFERDMPLLQPLAPRGRLLGVTPAVPQVAVLHRESGMPAPDRRGPAVGRGGLHRLVCRWCRRSPRPGYREGVGFPGQAGSPARPSGPALRMQPSPLLRGRGCVSLSNHRGDRPGRRSWDTPAFWPHTFVPGSCPSPLGHSQLQCEAD